MVCEISSLRDLTTGYVLNLFGGPTGRVGNRIHPWNCPHVQTMSIPPPKISADTIQELREWISNQGGELDPVTPMCTYC